jgi:hypothetical protein
MECGIMDDVDRDIARARIGKHDETLVNPYKPKQTEKPYYLPPIPVRGSYMPSYKSETKPVISDPNDGAGLSLLVLLFLAIIFIWFLGMTFGFW